MQGRILPAVSMKKAKELAKKMGLSYNELCLGVLSKTTKQYFIEQGDPDTSMVSILLPFTFHGIPKNPVDYVYQNNFSSLPFFLDLKEDINEACKLAQIQSNMIKKSIYVFGLYSLLWFYSTCMPVYWNDKISQS